MHFLPIRLFRFSPSSDLSSLTTNSPTPNPSDASLSLSLCNSLLHPNLHLFDISLGAYLQAGKPHVALQIFQKMIRIKLKPNHLTCNSLLIVLVRYPSSFSLLSARQVFDDMVKLGVSLNVKTFNVLTHGYCLEGKLDDAVGIIERMVSEFDVKPDNVTYNTILKAMSKKGRLNDVKELLLDMKKNGLVPNRDTYNNLVYGYCKLGSLKEAFQIAITIASKIIGNSNTYDGDYNHSAHRILESVSITGILNLIGISDHKRTSKKTRRTLARETCSSSD